MNVMNIAQGAIRYVLTPLEALLALVTVALHSVTVVLLSVKVRYYINHGNVIYVTLIWDLRSNINFYFNILRPSTIEYHN